VSNYLWRTLGDSAAGVVLKLSRFDNKSSQLAMY
jgi:hypothetical protein